MQDQTFTGRGNLVVDGQSYPVDYQLKIVVRGGLKDGYGIVTNEGGGAAAAYGVPKAVLQLAEGLSAPIIITEWVPAGSHSEFRLAGALT